MNIMIFMKQGVFSGGPKENDTCTDQYCIGLGKSPCAHGKCLPPYPFP